MTNNHPLFAVAQMMPGRDPALRLSDVLNLRLPRTLSRPKRRREPVRYGLLSLSERRRKKALKAAFHEAVPKLASSPRTAPQTPCVRTPPLRYPPRPPSTLTALPSGPFRYKPVWQISPAAAPHCHCHCPIPTAPFLPGP
ncbi:hypothetical protein L227DRAFT_435435 [Lentinus tigrinus ALCF2SS1-6]|uniref:Uncharacterized protein n=1 Tax=Lentinus tigrinus ALCF2SS1-6 TaxID=1328759 RepID=A0A5C2SHK4_9APHY|nr:hypothetical protein L227DRAFT_435435 [Lentinus tigrinus ALCF2SS1-6]